MAESFEQKLISGRCVENILSNILYRAYLVCMEGNGVQRYDAAPCDLLQKPSTVLIGRFEFCFE